MTDPLSPYSPDAEIELRFALAGIVLPAERKAGAIAGAKEMLAVTHWLRRPRTAAAEPSNIFSLTPGAAK
ncbi:MAG: hypothetical protein P4M09_14760 [Devosia sp.]|nr:hypothetical protein [Devosia sp.]